MLISWFCPNFNSKIVSTWWDPSSNLSLFHSTHRRTAPSASVAPLEADWKTYVVAGAHSRRRVIWILASETVFVQLNQYSQILRRQCCPVGRPMWAPVLRAAEVSGAAPGLQLVDDRAPVAFTSTFTNTVLRSVIADHLQFFIPIFAFCLLASSIQRT